MTDETIDIIDEPGRSRFTVLVDGQRAGHADYREVGTSVVFTHTEIAEEYGGRGLGTRLVSAALESVRDEGRTVAPLCPFFASYLEDNPDAAEVDRQLLEQLRKRQSED